MGLNFTSKNIHTNKQTVNTQKDLVATLQNSLAATPLTMLIGREGAGIFSSVERRIQKGGGGCKTSTASVSQKGAQSKTKTEERNRETERRLF